MRFEEALRELDAMVGRDVIVGISVEGPDNAPIVSLSGELRRAALGQVSAGDASFLFHVGRQRAPEDQTYFVLTRGDFGDAEWIDGGNGHRFFWIRSGGLLFTLSDRERLAESLEADESEPEEDVQRPRGFKRGTARLRKALSRAADPTPL